MGYLLTDAQWARIAPLLPGRARTKGSRQQNNRRFVKAMLWLLRNGCRWRALPSVWRNWHTTYTLPALDRHPRAYDTNRYAQRHPVERLFSRLKQFRRVAARYDKLDAHFIHLSAAVLGLFNC